MAITVYGLLMFIICLYNEQVLFLYIFIIGLYIICVMLSICLIYVWDVYIYIYTYYTHKVVFSVLVYGSHVSKLAFCAELGVIAGNVIPRDAFKSAARQIQSQRKSQARPRPSV